MPCYSTGGILAILFGVKRNSISDAEALYDRLVAKVRVIVPPLVSNGYASAAWPTTRHA
jgi:hypothetical protein